MPTPSPIFWIIFGVRPMHLNTFLCEQHARGASRGRTGVDDELRAPLRAQRGKLGEADVVADADAQAARVGVDDRDGLPGRQRVRLPERDLAGHVDVEQVHLM